MFVLPSWPEIYTTDEDRKMTFEDASAFDRRIRAVYEELEYVPVDVPRATQAQRAAFICTHLGETES